MKHLTHNTSGLLALDNDILSIIAETEIKNSEINSNIQYLKNAVDPGILNVLSLFYIFIRT